MKRIFAIIYLLLLVTAAYADSPFTYDPDDCLRMCGPYDYHEILPVETSRYTYRLGTLCREKYGLDLDFIYMQQDSLPGTLHFSFFASFQSVFFYVSWDELQNYLFWRIESAETGESFSEHCIASDYNRTQERHRIQMSFPVDLIPIPRDTSIYMLSLLILDNTDSTGNIVGQSTPATILITPLMDSVDSLLWLRSLPIHLQTVALWEDVLAAYPNYRELRSESLEFYRRHGEWQRAWDTALLLIQMYENNIDFIDRSPEPEIVSADYRGRIHRYADNHRHLRDNTLIIIRRHLNQSNN